MLKIDNSFYIRHDGNGYTLCKEHETGEINDKGNPVISKQNWYYAKLQYCLEKYLDECFKPNTEIQDIVSSIKEAMLNIEKLCKQLNQ